MTTGSDSVSVWTASPVRKPTRWSVSSWSTGDSCVAWYARTRPRSTCPRARAGSMSRVNYAALGVEHILTGPDHLLFVLGLVLLVAGTRRLLATVTAFTVGHSVTLSLAVLGFARVPPGPTEVLIALSVYALAVELARDARRPTLMRRLPWLVAAGFGLLHGLGFAGALRQAGLPAGDVPLALAAFNAGVELGQLLFIAAVLVVRRAVRLAPAPLPRWGAAVSRLRDGNLCRVLVLRAPRRARPLTGGRSCLADCSRSPS